MNITQENIEAIGRKFIEIDSLSDALLGRLCADDYAELALIKAAKNAAGDALEMLEQLENQEVAS